MNSPNSVPQQSWEIDIVVWSPDKPWEGHSGFLGLLRLLSQRATEGWEFVTVVRDIPDAGPCWIFKRPAHHPSAP